jgi:hypothetical protein
MTIGWLGSSGASPSISWPWFDEAKLERVDQLGDLAGQLEELFVCAELFVLGGELGVVLDLRHPLVWHEIHIDAMPLLCNRWRSPVAPRGRCRRVV